MNAESCVLALGKSSEADSGFDVEASAGTDFVVDFVDEAERDRQVFEGAAMGSPLRV